MQADIPLSFYFKKLWESEVHHIASLIADHEPADDTSDDECNCDDDNCDNCDDNSDCDDDNCDYNDYKNVSKPMWRDITQLLNLCHTVYAMPWRASRRQ